MYRSIIVLTILLWSSLAQTSGAVSSFTNLKSTQDDDSVLIRQTIEKFLGAYGRGSASEVMSFWAETSPDYAAQKKELEEALQKYVYSFDDQLISPVKVTGNKAVFRINVSRKEVARQSQQVREERPIYNVEMVKTEAGWKLWKYTSADKDQRDLAQALITAASIDAQNSLLINNPDLISSNIVIGILDAGRQSTNPENQLEIFQLAERVSKFVKGVSGKRVLLFAVVRIADVYFRQNDYAQALEYFQRSKQIAEEIPDNLHVQLAKLNIGNVHYSQGNISLALISYLDGIDFLKRPGTGSQPKNYAQLLLQIGELYLLLDKDDLAIGYFKQAQKEYMEITKIKEYLRDGKTGMANALLSLATARIKQGNSAQALNSYREARQIYQELLEEKNLGAFDQLYLRLALTTSLVGIGNAYAAQPDLANALRSFDEAKQICQKYSLERSSAFIDVLLEIARIYDKQGNHEQALKESDAAISQTTLPGVEHLAYSSHMMRGRILNHANRVYEAQKAFDQAIKTADFISGNLFGDEQDRLRFVENNAAAAIENASLMVALKKYEEAFSYAERAKARVLIASLRSDRLLITKGTTLEEQTKEREYNLSIIQLNRDLHAERQQGNWDSPKAKRIEKELGDARSRLESFQKELYFKHRELKLRRGEIDPISLAATSELLPNQKSALIEFIVAEDKTVVLVLLPSSSSQPPVEIHGFLLDIKRPALQQKIGEFREQLEAGGGGFRPLSEELHTLLFEKAQSLLKDKTSLIIVPDGPLWDLPFSALSSKGGPYMIEKASISYATSLTYLRAVRENRNRLKDPSLRPLLAFGNPAVDQNSPSQSRSRVRGDALAPLPFAEDEVKAVGKRLGARQDEVLIGPQALEESFKKRAAQYRVLHLATHAVLDNYNSMYSYIVMSQVGNKGEEDGLLEAREILGLDLNAEMVVLSACQTARGKIRTGGAAVGLSWALQVAGVPTVIASQWAVTDQSTKDLMDEFYSQITQRPRQSKAESLRQASLKIMKTKKHPHDWAPFVLIGDGR